MTLLYLSAVRPPTARLFSAYGPGTPGTLVQKLLPTCLMLFLAWAGVPPVVCCGRCFPAPLVSGKSGATP
jgi:hypothetical protein